jgi:hypothetical protein
MAKIVAGDRVHRIITRKLDWFEIIAIAPPLVLNSYPNADLL